MARAGATPGRGDGCRALSYEHGMVDLEPTTAGEIAASGWGTAWAR
jgi:hypothetical protein